MKRLIGLLILFIAGSILVSYSQSTYVKSEGDTLVVISPKDLFLINCAFSDLRYTKAELEVCDSIITRKDSVISYLKKELTYSKEISSSYRNLLEIEKNNSRKKSAKVGFISAISGLVIGVVTGVLIK